MLSSEIDSKPQSKVKARKCKTVLQHPKTTNAELDWLCFKDRSNRVLLSRFGCWHQILSQLLMLTSLFRVVFLIVFLPQQKEQKLIQCSMQGKFFWFFDCKNQHTRTCSFGSALWWCWRSGTLKWQKRCRLQ